ncbi:MAG: 5'-nucleotidase, partial [Ilumatobacter sp.]
FLGKKPQVEANAYIDDAPHNIEQLRSAGNTVIAFEQPYNRDIEGLRATNWGEVEAIVTDLATQYTGQFEGQLPGIDAGSDRLDRNRD